MDRQTGGRMHGDYQAHYLPASLSMLSYVFNKNVNPNLTLPYDEAISHKKCTINAIQCIFARFGLQVVLHPWKPWVSRVPDCPRTKSAKYGSYSIHGSGFMKNHSHIWHTCIWTHLCGSCVEILKPESMCLKLWCLCWTLNLKVDHLKALCRRLLLKLLTSLHLEIEIGIRVGFYVIHLYIMNQLEPNTIWLLII